MPKVDRTVAAHYGLDLAALDELERKAVDDYDPSSWGLRRYSAITDVTQRALASDLLISLCEGTKVALLDLAMASERYSTLIGPSGRPVPGRRTTIAERVETSQLEAASTECFRALSSALNCLAGLCVLIIGLPLPVPRAEASWLLRRPEGAPAPPLQEETWSAIAAIVDAEANVPRTGWLAWALETHDALVHRGHVPRTWLDRPGEPRVGEPRLLVWSRSAQHNSMRMEERLQRRPWLPDLYALVEGVDMNQRCLAEPAQLTLQHLQHRVTELVARAVAGLHKIWDNLMDRFDWPAAQWQLQRQDSGWRVDLAEPFGGFEPEYLVVPPPQIPMDADDSVQRRALATRLWPTE